MYRIGVDLGGTNIAAGVVDGTHRILAAATAPTYAARGPEAVADDIAQTVHNALDLCGVALTDCAAVGVGSPGICDGAAGTVRNAHNLRWYGVPIVEMLRERLGLPVHLSNDGNCAALGEVLAGAAQGCESALLVTLGTGVGAGLVENGRISAGWRGLGGEMGHICVAMDGEPCTCGQKGCWEAYASATALIRQAKRAAENAPASALNAADKLDGRSIYAAAAGGDAAARAVVAKYAEYVGVGLVSLINAFFPEIVLLGGGVAGAGDALFAPVREYVGANLFVGDPALAPRIRPAALGNDAGIIGAAALE